MTMRDPTPGLWYQPFGISDFFQVLDVDECGSITIEHFDGFVDVFSTLDWNLLQPQVVLKSDEPT